MTTVLRALDEFRRSNSDIVLNPVNPEENFADRWKLPRCQHLHLKENFHRWIVQAAADFGYFIQQSDQKALMERAEARLRVRPTSNAVAAALGSTAAVSTISSSPRHVSIQSPPKPWSRYR
jgi:hypothetical protein